MAALVLPSTAKAAGEEQLQQGIELLRQKEYRQALALFDQVKLEGGDARPYFYSGLALSETGQLSQAAAELRQAIAMDADQPEYSLVYAEVLTRLGRKLAANEALGPFEGGRNLDRLGASELWLLADLYLKLDQLDKSLGALEAYEKARPQDPRLPLRRGEILLRNGDYQEAEQAYRKALEQEVEPATARYGLGLALWRQNRLEQARAEIEAAQDLRPQNLEYSYQLGLILLDLGLADEALTELEKLEPLGDQFPPIYSALAKAARRAGESDRSSEYFRKFREIQALQHERETSQQRADVLVTQAAEKLAAGRAAEAESLLLQAARANPESWVAHKLLARAYLNSARSLSAYSHLKRLEELSPGSFDFHSLMALYWYQQKRPLQAQEHAEKAKDLSPGDAELRNLLGNVYLQVGKRVEALEEYRAATSLDPQRSDFKLNFETLQRSLEKRP